jgi:hypothetical protein
MLKRMPQLDCLNLSGTKITDESGISLSKLTNLQQLGLARTAFSDRGVSAIKRLPELWSLDLSRTVVTDSAIECIGTLPELQNLLLANTCITDRGIVRLGELRPEENGVWRHFSLNLADCPTTENGVAALRLLHSGWDINRDSPPDCEQDSDFVTHSVSILSFFD